MNFITFKNVGIQEYEAANLVSFVSRSINPVGIKMPVSNGINSLFEMNMNFEDQIKDNLTNLLMTNHGERLGNYYYGANLKPLLTEYVNDDSFNASAMLKINTALNRYMSFIVPEDFASEPIFERSLNSDAPIQIKIVLRYTVPRINQTTKKTIEIILGLIG